MSVVTAAAVAAASAGGNPACWHGSFTFKTCCDSSQGPQGNPSCFDALYTFESCCKTGGHMPAGIGDCRKPGEVEALPRALRCQGTPWVEADEWESLFYAHQLSRSVGTSFKGWPDVYKILKKANASRAAWRASEEDCIFGLLTAIFHSLPMLERLHGHSRAYTAYVLANRLRGGVHNLEELDCRWLEMTNHAMFAHYPLLLEGDPGLVGDCPAGMPRIFVYDTGTLAAKPISCARTGFWSSEVYVDRFLRRSGCREYDWRKADLFFVPVYLTCWELQDVNGFDFEKKAEAAQRVADKVRSLPNWGRRGGLDHVFLFGASAWQMPDWRMILRSSVVLAVESRPIECIPEDTLCWHCENCFQPWKDLVIPPVTPLTRAHELLMRSQPVQNRTLIMSWHGQHANSSDSEVRRAYRVTNETVRLGLLEIAHLPNVSLGGPVSGYAEVLGNSQFCLCPKGASSYTSRVFEALFAGCIPVLLSDDARLPFGDIADWSTFSIRWPMNRTDVSLYEYLRDLLAREPERVLAMQREVARVRCWFDYFGLEGALSECSPYVAILRGLASRMRQMPVATEVPVPFAGALQ
eukprot:TRINITY_DN76074_c0_g1_i1.p1 TRINITY_DN76074_c0_g1~~TRINITY_DN76074_c0_g1_i1.p1  ORF type:complete len:580 (-),score=78.41 TRINITY_DN76074_c0_g1_i1:124-1863(-)